MAEQIIAAEIKIPFDYSVLRPCKKCGIMFSGRKCNACNNAGKRLRRLVSSEKEKIGAKAYREKNREKIRQSAIEYRAKNPEKVKQIAAKCRAKNKEKSRAYSSSYRKQNKELILEKSAIYRISRKEAKKRSAKLYREKNLDKVKAQFARWVAANPDANRVRVQNRRARRIESGGVLSKGLAEKLYKLQQGKCVCCAQPLNSNYHLDHKIPLSRGGSNTDENMQLLTAVCNMQKHAQDPIDFMQSRGFLL